MYANQFLTQGQFTMQSNMEHTIIADSIEYAEDSFVDAKERLLDVNNWKRYSGQLGITFLLNDDHGREVHRRARKGDHIRISVPGGEDAHYCVVIEALEYDDYPDLSMEAFTMRIRPCAHSTNNEEDDTEDPVEGALIIERRSKHLFASFNLRNTAVNNGQVANKFGVSEAGWNTLLKRFVD